ncbi:MAG: MlaD family protein [Verrucomicrobiales bacterium]|jgi:paraquat-inducible protein B|nr:MlaD family protein [Verrucomicrobiales bacterium]
MNSDAKYFRIGLFVISALLILLLGVLALGAKNWFEPKLTFETYFDGTIGGINVGSPVKFRGVPLGKVTRIDFTPNVYPEPPISSNNAPNKYRYILVEFEIKKSLIIGLLRGDLDDLQKDLNVGINRGMRIRVDMAGIAGGNYLEIDRLDPQVAPPPLEINWTPRHYYIPSANSAITQIVNSLNQTLRNLGKVDFDEIQKKMVSLIDQLDQNTQQFNVLVQRINHMDLAGTADNIRIITEELKDTSTRLKSDPSQIIWSAQPAPAKSLDNK